MSTISLGKDLYIKGRIGWRGLNKNEYLDRSNYRIINATALMDGYIDWDNCGYISRERYEESSEIILKENDILISKDGTIGKIGFVKNLTFPCTVASGIFVVRNEIQDKLNTDYLYHLLKSDIFKDFIRRNKSDGSTINHLYQRDLENFIIDLPSIEEQKNISSILNIIDNKIKINDDIIKSSEDFINILFNKWFFEYDYPLKDEDELKFDSNLNINIPSLWTVEKLGNIEKNIITGKTPSTKISEYFNGNIPFITIDDIRKGTYIINSEKKLSKLGADSQKNKYLPINTICVSCIATVGLVGLTTKESQTNQQINSIICKNPNNIFYLLNYLRNYFKFTSGAKNGNIFKNMNKDDFSSIDVIYPPDNLLKQFNDIVEPYYNLIKKNLDENYSLIDLKKILLPMLMNHQLIILN